MIDQRFDDLMARLERERLDADRLYQEALTALDQAVRASHELPDGPPSPDADAAPVPQLDKSWDILPDGIPDADGSLTGRLRGFIWRLVGPPLQTQKQFNAAIVDHLNRSRASERRSTDATGEMRDAVVREFQALAHFEWRLLQFLRTITLYVDTKDRSLGGSNIQERLDWAEQRILALKREAEAAPAKGGTEPPAPRGTLAGRVDSTTYVGFENRFRGSEEEVRSRAEDYLPLLTSASDVVDIGCGRGELLGLLKAHGRTARGVDANPSMVGLCRSRGLEVEEGDALSYIERQNEGSIGGLTAIQVVEHFEPAYLARFLEAAHHKMRPGAPLVLETINPACWAVFFDVYIRDLTHQRPLHPETLKYLVEANGFRAADVRFSHPFRDVDRLPQVPVPGEGEGVARLAAVVNAHAEMLNARLFSFTDYAVIARR